MAKRRIESLLKPSASVRNLFRRAEFLGKYLETISDYAVRRRVKSLLLSIKQWCEIYKRILLILYTYIMHLLFGRSVHLRRII